MISNRTKPLETRRCPKCERDHPATLFNNLGFCVYCAQSQAQQQVPDSLKTRVEGLADDPLKAKRREHLRIQANKAKALAKIEARKQAKEAENSELDAAEAAKQEMARRELAKTHLLPFILRFNDKYEPGWVHKDICDKLEWFSAAVPTWPTASAARCATLSRSQRIGPYSLTPRSAKIADLSRTG